MPQVTIDGQPHDFEAGERLLQFCLDRGIEIPHFCYHPALSVPANCRQCLVKVGTPVVNRETKAPELDEAGRPKIQYMPKLQPGCVLDMAEGMVVHTQYDAAEVAAAQADNLELMLINHPLDCPICDQAGQCPLQIQAYKYGPEGSRFEFEKAHRPKRVQLGPNVVLDAERCINCTRCTRFTEEVSGTHALSIVNRGDKNYPLPAPGQPFDEPYSMCVTDLCPVGALTEDYFRFKARVWEMAKTPTVSDFGAKGINVDVWVRGNEVLRITPRQNLDVNQYWMPDAARLVYARYNENRPDGPTLRGEGAGRTSVDWRRAYDEAARLLKRHGANTLFIASPWATVEDNYLLMKLAEAVGAEPPVYYDHRKEGTGDGWLVSDDPSPNAAGCERLGLRAADPPMIRTRLQAGEIGLVYLLDEDPVGAGLHAAVEFEGVPTILHHHHTTHAMLLHAAVAFPSAMSVETIGTFVNEEGRAQRLRPARTIRGMNRSLMMALGVGQSRNDRQGTPFDRWYEEDLKVDCQPGWAILPELAERLGRPMRHKSPEALMAAIAAEVPAFEGATYAAMDMLGVQLQSIGEAV